IELEGGGKPELARIIKEKIFAPYTWRVRRFKEGNAHETLIRFTPEGDPYGFRVKLPNEETCRGSAAHCRRDSKERMEYRLRPVSTRRIVERRSARRPHGSRIRI